MKRPNSYLLAYLLAFAGTMLCKAEGLTRYVNPLMGTHSSMELSNGNTYPTVCLPFGMNNWAPHTGKLGNGFLYTYQENFLYGFKQTHQASLWINDYGQLSVMPITHRNDFTEERRRSWFSHKTEIALPHYYHAYLGDAQTNVELTPTERAAAFRMRFNGGDSSYVVIDACNGGSYVKLIPQQKRIVGYSTKNNGGVGPAFKNFFVITFNRPFLNATVWKDKQLLDGQYEQQGQHVGAVVGFDLKRGETVEMHIATSYISEEQAELNLREIGSQSFDEVKAKAEQTWDAELAKVSVAGGTDDELRTFYTCLYRMLIFPRKFYEIDAKGDTLHYSPYNGRVMPGILYADNGFWDTFRAQFPFLNLMYPNIVAEILRGLENVYKESGWLPEWFSPGHRDCMIGQHSASVITDAYLKGIRGYDIGLLYEAIRKSTEGVGPVGSVGRKGFAQYNALGYVPCDVDINQNVSRTLEYAYDDYCIYRLAQALNRPKKEQETFRQRSLNYRHLFDKNTGLMRPKDSKGRFLTPFDPYRWGDHFTEGNSWQYTWFVPHDVIGLQKLMGGQAKFVEKLDSVFSQTQRYDISYYKRGIIHLIREMQNADMGQYAHLNEPMHHVPYLYAFCQPWKTQRLVRTIMSRLYAPRPDGYCGDEDNGQMSAWYVFSALGFYPLSPISGEYAVGSPLFRQATLHLPNGKTIHIAAPQNSPTNIYVSQLLLNGQPYHSQFVKHSELIKGAKLEFKMRAEENVPAIPHQ